MRETVRSLRAYFIVVGLISGGMQIKAFGAGGLDVVDMVVCGIDLAFAAGFVYFGVQLPTLLRENASLILRTLVASAVVTLLSAGLATFYIVQLPIAMKSAVVGALAARILVTLLITWYLYRSTKRLAAEAARPTAAVAALFE